MERKTAQLLKEIEQVTAGQCFGSEADYPILPFIWEVSEQGLLTPAQLLMSEGFLQIEKIDDIFPQAPETDRLSGVEDIQGNALLQQDVIHFLSSNCKSVEAYTINKNDAYDYPDNEFESFPLIIAEASTDQWIGIVPDVGSDSSARRAKELRDVTISYAKQDGEVDEAIASLVTELERRLSNVQFLTRQLYEPDYVVDEYILRVAESKDSLLSRLLYSSGFINVYEFEDLGQGTEELEHLDQLLRTNLTYLREYVVGCMSIFYLYDIGQTANGDWVGIRTTAIWT